MRVDVIEKKEVINFLKEKHLPFHLKDEVVIGLIDEKIEAIMCLNDTIIDYVYFSDSFFTKDCFNLLYNSVKQYLLNQGKYTELIYTFKKYQEMFEKNKATSVSSSSNLCILDGDRYSYYEVLAKYRKQIEYKFEKSVDESDICGVVMKCNPMTIKHLDVLENLARMHQFLVVFLLQDQDLMFRFEERMSMVYLSSLPYKNIIVFPSTKYLVSNEAFPEFFELSTNCDEKAQLDAKILRHFQKHLNISCFYYYNDSNYFRLLKQYFDDLKYISTIELPTNHVRQLIMDKKGDEVMEYIPNSIKAIFSLLERSK